MKIAGIFGIALLVSGCSLAAEIPQGSHVLLRMTNSISTRTAAEGDRVYLQTASPIAVDGQIVVPVGSYVQGVVSHAQRSGRVSGRADLGIRLETLTLPGGKTLKLTPRLSSVDSNETGQRVTGGESQIKPGSDRGKDAARIAILAGTGASIGGLAGRSWKGAGLGGAAGAAVGFATTLLTRGRDVELRQGSTLDVQIDHPIVIE